MPGRKAGRHKVTTVEMFVSGGQVVTRTPYNAAFIATARTLRGSWDKGSETWRFPLGRWGDVEALMRAHYGNAVLVHSPVERDRLQMQRERLQAELADVEHRIAMIDGGVASMPPTPTPADKDAEPAPIGPLPAADELFKLD